MIQPTLRAVLAFGGSVPLALLAASIDQAWWPVAVGAGAVVLAAMAFDAAAAFPVRRLAIAVTAPAQILIGETGFVTASVAPGYPRPLRLALLAEQRGPLDPAEITSLELAPGAGGSARLPLQPRRRGRIAVSRLWVRWTGPWRLVQQTRTIPVGREIDVLPNTRGVRGAALQYFSDEAIFGAKVQRRRGEGTEFDSLRDFAPGMDHRVIDWKHTARHRKLLSKEFRTERNHHVILAFDTGYLMLEPLDGVPRLDHAINAGLALAWVALQSGDLVGSYGFDAVVRQAVPPTRGVTGFARLLRATAGLDYHHEETNFTLGLAELGARLPHRALVVLFTDFVDTVTAELMIESVQRVARRHLVVFVTLQDPFIETTVDAPPDRFEAVAEAVIAHDFRRDRMIVLDRLRRLGVHCLDVPKNGLSAGLLNRYLLIKQRGLL